MARVRVSIVIASSPAAVWEEVRRIDCHPDWMTDVLELRFTSTLRTGAGTRFDRVRRVGPMRIVEPMSISSWREGREIGLRRRGRAVGTGRFTLSRIRGDRTRFTWSERLLVPWRFGGPIGGFIAAIVLRRTWRRNLQVLKALVESGRDERSGVLG